MLRLAVLCRARSRIFARFFNGPGLNTRAGFEKSLPVLAHELGHHILGHGRGMGGSAHEMAANAVAVEVIQVWGYSEREAVALVGGMLCRRQARGAVEVGARPRD